MRTKKPVSIDFRGTEHKLRIVPVGSVVEAHINGSPMLKPNGTVRRWPLLKDALFEAFEYVSADLIAAGWVRFHLVIPGEGTLERPIWLPPGAMVELYAGKNTHSYAPVWSGGVEDVRRGDLERAIGEHPLGRILRNHKGQFRKVIAHHVTVDGEVVYSKTLPVEEQFKLVEDRHAQQLAARKEKQALAKAEKIAARARLAQEYFAKNPFLGPKG